MHWKISIPIASLAACALIPLAAVRTAEAQPAISNISVEPAGVSIVVRFDTSQDALCAAEFGLTDAYGGAAMQAPVAARRQHRITLRGLQSSTEHHLRVGCLGEGGAAIRSSRSEGS